MKAFSKVLFTCALSLVATKTFASPARVLIIRHAEKPTSATNDDLSPRGFERAKALTTLFQRQPALASFGLPVTIFAFKYIPGSTSHRGVETALPLAKSLGQQLDTSFVPTQNTELAQKILGNAAYDKKMVMVVWKHSEIQTLAQSLGAKGAPAWDVSVFDRIWQIDFDMRGNVVSFKDLPQNLLQGDSLSFISDDKLGSQLHEPLLPAHPELNEDEF